MSKQARLYEILERANRVNLFSFFSIEYANIKIITLNNCQSDFKHLWL